MDKLSDISVDLKLKHLQSRDLLFSVLNVKTVIPQNFIYEIIPPAADQRSLHLIPMYVGTLCRINICSEQSSKIWNDKTYVTRLSIFFSFFWQLFIFLQHPNHYIFLWNQVCSIHQLCFIYIHRFRPFFSGLKITNSQKVEKIKTRSTYYKNVHFA